jgi:hypothetical protein
MNAPQRQHNALAQVWPLSERGRVLNTQQHALIWRAVWPLSCPFLPDSSLRNNQTLREGRSMNAPQRQHWEYPQRRAKPNRLSQYTRKSRRHYAHH